MTDNVEGNTLHWMRQLDKKVDRVLERLEDMATLQHQMYQSILALRRDALSTDEIAAMQRVQFERLVERVERIERRLELADDADS